ncbi:MAG: 4-(cytidine 5'-diphospho)-2-C-methyl-D-erythritol kinase [Thermogutta sp.]
MDVQRCGTTWVVHAPAKVNLFFEVLGRREDGYHLVETLVCPISLFDTLLFEESSGQEVVLTVELITGEASLGDCGFDTVPEGPTNLIHRAARLIQEEMGTRKGARVRLLKRIPTGAGLGGGSADAAAALKGLCRMWGLNPAREVMASWAARLGSDVPLFLENGACVCRGRGEIIERLPEFTRLNIVVVKPAVSLSTASVYAACRVPERPRSIQPVLEAWSKGELTSLGEGMFNRLAEAAERLTPAVRDLGDRLRETNCLGALMTGSGSCCFALYRHRKQAIAAARKLKAERAGAVFVVHTVA